MSLNFPASPKRGDTITAGSRKWKFTGTAWIRVDRANQGDRGFPGATGATGATGPAGATGPVEEFVASINGLTGGITTDGLTFAFAGISVGAFGITTDGAVSFSGVTGDIKNPSSGSAKIDISVGSSDFTLGRFARTNGVVTVGDVDQASNGTRIEVTTKTQTVDVYAGQKLHLHNGVFFPANGISLGVGLTFPDGSFQSSAHAPHEFVASFNGATGAIEGVNSFNGLTGAVTTTDLSLQVKGISASVGITFADGSHQNTAAERGYQYTVSSTTLSDTPGSGQCVIDDVSGVVQFIRLHATDADGNNLTSLLENFKNVGGNIKFCTLDGKTVGQAHSNYRDTTRVFGSSVLSLTLSGANLGFILEEPTVGDTLYFTIEPNDVDMVSSLGGFTGSILVQEGIEVVEVAGLLPIFRQDKSFTKNTATFTISASSAIATGKKTDSLHRFPYDATITGIDVKVNGSGGFTAGAIIAGPDFGNPATSSLTGGTLGIAGTTGSITGGFNNTSVTAGGFMFFDVVSNGSGSTQAQMFVSYERR
jgi:hypothetical protein